MQPDPESHSDAHPVVNPDAEFHAESDAVSEYNAIPQRYLDSDGVAESDEYANLDADAVIDTKPESDPFSHAHLNANR